MPLLAYGDAVASSRNAICRGMVIFGAPLDPTSPVSSRSRQRGFESPAGTQKKATSEPASDQRVLKVRAIGPL
jgi:hypothetical protein